MSMVKATRTGHELRAARAGQEIQGFSVDEDLPQAPDSPGTAEYVARMTAELADLAGAARLDMLAYFLNLARLEAEGHYLRRK